MGRGRAAIDTATGLAKSAIQRKLVALFINTLPWSMLVIVLAIGIIMSLLLCAALGMGAMLAMSGSASPAMAAATGAGDVENRPEIVRALEEEGVDVSACSATPDTAPTPRYLGEGLEQAWPGPAPENPEDIPEYNKRVREWNKRSQDYSSAAPAWTGPAAENGSLSERTRALTAQIPPDTHPDRAYAYLMAALGGGVSSWEHFQRVVGNTRIDRSNAVAVADQFFTNGTAKAYSSAATVALMDWHLAHGGAGVESRFSELLEECVSVTERSPR